MINKSQQIMSSLNTVQQITGSLNSEQQITGSLNSAQQITGDIQVVKGLSAYQIAILNGFIGTEEEWLESLHADIDLVEISNIEIFNIFNSNN